jgi:hypothetical protein
MGSGDRSTDLQLPETADFSYRRLAEAGLADFVAFFFYFPGVEKTALAREL